jgi:hypothetical protein
MSRCNLILVILKSIALTLLLYHPIPLLTSPMKREELASFEEEVVTSLARGAGRLRS